MKKEVFSLIVLLALCASTFNWSMEPDVPKLPEEMQTKILQEYINTMEQIDWEKVLTLVQGGADPNTMDKDGNTLINILINESIRLSRPIATSTLEMLLKHGANPNIVNATGVLLSLSAGISPLVAVIFSWDLLLKEKILLIKSLLRYGADPGQVLSKMHNITAVHAATSKEEVDILKILLDHPKGIQAVNKQALDGWTPLHFAATSKNLEIITLLLNKGADPQIKNNKGKSPIDRAKDLQRDNEPIGIQDTLVNESIKMLEEAAKK